MIHRELKLRVMGSPTGTPHCGDVGSSPSYFTLALCGLQSFSYHSSVDPAQSYPVNALQLCSFASPSFDFLVKFSTSCLLFELDIQR